VHAEGHKFCLCHGVLVLESLGKLVNYMKNGQALREEFLLDRDE
jgi:hypothetical protein